MKKRVLSLFLACIMVLTLLPMNAFAAGEPTGIWSEAVTAQPEGFQIDTGERTISISSNDALAWFGKQLNSGANYSGYTISVSGKLDMGDHYWIPINAHNCGNLSDATIQLYVQNT